MNNRLFHRSENLERAAYLSPKDWYAHNDLAEVLASRNEQQRAAEELKQSIELRLEQRRLILDGPVKISLENTTGKTETIKIDRQYLNPGLILTCLQDYQGALKALDKSLEENPGPEKFRARAAVWKALGKDDKARSDLIS